MFLTVLTCCHWEMLVLPTDAPCKRRLGPGRHGMFEVNNTNSHSSCKCMGYSALAFIIQHLSTGTEKKVGKAGAVASWFLQVSLCFMFHFLRSVVSKTFWNGFELLNYLGIRHLDLK